MKTYPNNDKAMYLERVRAHRAADTLIQGTGWNGTEGCSVGCAIHEYDHAKYSELIGVPEWLARLQDFIFERLPKADALAWPERLLTAIPEGVDLNPVWPKFVVRMLTRCLARCGDGDEPWRADCRLVIGDVILIYGGGWPSPLAADATYAAYAAYAAAGAAADAAADAAGAAYAAARAADAAADAADATYAAYAADAAADAAYAAYAAAGAAGAAEARQQADDLIELIAEVKS